MLLFTGFLFCVVGMVPCPSEGGVAGTVKVSSSPVCLLRVAGVVLSVWLPQRGPSAAARTRQGHPEGLVADVWGSLPAGVHGARPLRRPLRSAGGGPGSRSWCRGLSAPVHISCTPARPPPGPGPRVAVGWSGGGAFNCLGQGSEVRWAFWHGRQLGGCSGGGQWSAGASSRSQVGCILGLSTVGLDLAFRQLLKCCGHVSCLLLSCSLEERWGWLSLELRLGLWEELVLRCVQPAILQPEHRFNCAFRERMCVVLLGGGFVGWSGQEHFAQLVPSTEQMLTGFTRVTGDVMSLCQNTDAKLGRAFGDGSRTCEAEVQL